MSGEDIGLHWGAALPAVVSLLIILIAPAFATQSLEELGIKEVYTDGGYAVYYESYEGAYCFAPPAGFTLESSDTANPVWTERKLFMPYGVYSL